MAASGAVRMPPPSCWGCLTALGRQQEMLRKPGTDLHFRAQFAGNSVSVPGFAPWDELIARGSPQNC